jgi:hypothetical protein
MIDQYRPRLHHAMTLPAQGQPGRRAGRPQVWSGVPHIPTCRCGYSFGTPSSGHLRRTRHACW